MTPTPYPSQTPFPRLAACLRENLLRLLRRKGYPLHDAEDASQQVLLYAIRRPRLHAQVLSAAERIEKKGQVPRDVRLAALRFLQNARTTESRTGLKSGRDERRNPFQEILDRDEVEACYARANHRQRQEIDGFLKCDSRRKIAARLEVSPPTVGRDLKRLDPRRADT